MKFLINFKEIKTITGITHSLSGGCPCPTTRTDRWTVRQTDKKQTDGKTDGKTYVQKGSNTDIQTAKYIYK